MVQAADCDPTPRTPEEISELFSRLEDALIKQIEVHCTVALVLFFIRLLFYTVELISPSIRYFHAM